MPWCNPSIQFKTLQAPGRGWLWHGSRRSIDWRLKSILPTGFMTYIYCICP